MRDSRIWRLVLGVQDTVIERVVFDEDAGAVIVSVRPVARAQNRCGLCRARCARYDGGIGRRRWRSTDWGEVAVYLEAPAPRVSCREHAVVVAAVPWARHDAGHTRSFDDTVTWMATQMSQSAIRELMRIAWRTVGVIVARVWADTGLRRDRLAGLRRIGIDEVAYKKGHKYLTVVVDHDSGRLVWAAEGRDKATLHTFFDELGRERTSKLTHISADGASWIAAVLVKRCPKAVRCADPFHVVAWANQALDTVRRAAWNRLRNRAASVEPPSAAGKFKSRSAPSTTPAATVKKTRWALVKKPQDLTDNQKAALAWIEVNDRQLHRAYLLKEALRLVFALPHEQAVAALDAWISWARRCRIPAFVALQKTIVKHRPQILASIEHNMSNGRVESVNTKIRLITRRGFGFHSPDAVIALAMLSLGGARPQLPGRKTHG
ncbi:ISL3 family transposase [Antrihabitans sp. NCIMB 15449]|uniref:ISL3 family transposase n=1 Tax=Antrihabitans spumae TaxID=3373370 RepID=A0ABW7JJD5_9NOCA